jgi:parallel beta-helix repeat protein
LIITKPIKLIGNGSRYTTIRGNNNDNGFKINSNNVNITGFKIERFNGIGIKNNEKLSFCQNNCSFGLSIIQSKSFNIIDNKFLSFGIYISGDRLDYWNSHILNNNTINGKLIDYRKNIDNLTIKMNGGLLILANCKNLKISNQNITNCLYGISMGFSEGNTIYNCNFKSNYNDIVLFRSHSNIIEKNLFINHSDSILLRNSDSNKIKENEFVNKDRGIRLDYSNLNIIEMNEFSNVGLGLSIYNSDLNTIINNNYPNCNMGILIRESNQNFIEKNNFCNGLTSGISLYSSDFNTINKNIFNFNSGDGIEIINGFSNIIFKNSLISNKNHGISLGGTSNIIYENNCSGNEKNGIDVKDKSNSVYNNTCLLNLFNGISLSSDSNSLETNSCNLNNKAGISITSSNNNSLEKNICNHNNEDGIILESSDFNKIISNICKSNNFDGIAIFSSTSNKLKNNSCCLNKNSGIRSEDSVSNEFDKNKCYNNSLNGIIIISNDPSKNEWNSVRNNNISNNKNGIFISSDSNKCFTNLIYENSENGLDFDFHSQNNSIFSNIIIDNVQQAEDDGFNFWDNGLGEGNYWSDWTYPDNNNDGIVDIPYNISGFTKAKDYYPLTKKHIQYPNLSPKINHSMRDIEIFEDTVSIGLINLNDWFYDPDGDSLNFACMDTDNLTIRILNDGSVKILPKKDWNGKESLKFSANDTISEIIGFLNITVIGINDPPEIPIIINPIHNEIFDISEKIDFNGICWDPDENYGDKLNFTWISNISGILGHGSVLKNITLPYGNHTITLYVVDLINIANSSNITITISNLDSDSDGYNDSIERKIGTNPFDNTSYPDDFDLDLIPDKIDSDDDNDGYNDTQEIFNNTNPLNPSDHPDNNLVNDDNNQNTIEIETRMYIIILIIISIIIIFLIVLKLHLKFNKKKT